MMCDHDPAYANQARIQLHHPSPSGRTEGFCDPCIAPLVQALNDAGMQTVASCCGHGHQPPSIALEDGRWVIVTDRETYKDVARRFPDIHGEPSLGALIQDLHDSEINAKVEWFFDGLFTVTLGDEMNGWGDSDTGLSNVAEVAASLVTMAVNRYPNSEFARKYTTPADTQIAEAR